MKDTRQDHDNGQPRRRERSQPGQDACERRQQQTQPAEQLASPDKRHQATSVVYSPHQVAHCQPAVSPFCCVGNTGGTMLPTLESSAVAKIDPRVKRTRKLLLDAFSSLISEKSFEDITVQDIAARATVNRATFYAHLVDKLIREDFAQLLQRRLATHTGSAQEHLRQIFLAVTDHWTMHHGQCQHSHAMYDSVVEAQVRAQLRDNVCSWLLEHSAQAHSRQRVDL